MTDSLMQRSGQLWNFLQCSRPAESPEALTAVSLFSGAGLSDAGYCVAGFRFVVQVERDRNRAQIGSANFPASTWLIGDARKLSAQVVATYNAATSRRLDLLVATPPCQGMSSSNPSRGKRGTKSAREHEAKNRLLLAIVPVVKHLKPRVVVVENVRQLLTHTTTYRGKKIRLVDRLRSVLSDYEFFEGILNVADYGIPQDRRRAILVAVSRDETWAASIKRARRSPWPCATHDECAKENVEPWVTIREWFDAVQYAPLDARTKMTTRNGHPLHNVPHYDDHRYSWVSSIPPHTGRSAYENSTCPECGTSEVSIGRIRCPKCRGIMSNRPHVVCRGGARLVRGFKSSYRRMPSDLPSRTITTNTSHLGSDYKIHPWENRVLSALECADLQTVPRWYDWTPALTRGRQYTIRNVVGEAFPPYFTYLHGAMLAKLLRSTAADLPLISAGLSVSQAGSNAGPATI